MKQVFSLVLLLFTIASVTRGHRSLGDILREEGHKFIRSKSCHAVSFSNLDFP